MGGSSPIRRDLSQKSNAELMSSLRDNFAAHMEPLEDENVNGDGPADEPPPNTYTTWTHMADDGRRELEIPALDFEQSPGLAEEREQYDITAKLFYLPGAPVETRATQTRDAVNLVLKELRMPSIDLLIVSFPGIYFDETEDCPDKISTRGPVDAPPEPLESQLETWKWLEELRDRYKLIGRLGVSELGHDRLASFLEAAASPPAVNQINLRDCCSVPKNLLQLAKKRKIDLLVHNDSSNILPRGAVRELLGGDVGILAEPPSTGAKRKSLHGEEKSQALPDPRSGERLRGEVQPLWVVKYTAVVKDRGVVEHKGYFAVSELVE